MWLKLRYFFQETYVRHSFLYLFLFKLLNLILLIFVTTVSVPTNKGLVYYLHLLFNKESVSIMLNFPISLEMVF